MNALTPGTAALWHRSHQGLPPRPVHVVQLLPVKVRVLDLVESTRHRLVFREVNAANLTAKVLLLICLILATAGGLRAQDAPHLMRLQDMALAAPGSPSVPTHVVLEGVVELNRREKDGDRHLRICEGGLCIIAECIPGLPDVCAAARVGDRVWVTGISRFDAGHGRHTPADAAKYGHEVGWWELHPVTALEVK